MSLRVAALLLLASALWSGAAGSNGDAKDCCLRTTNVPLSLRVVQSYFIQSVSGGCQIDATIFVTKRNKKLCAPPAFRNNWAAKLIKKLKRRARSKTRTNGREHVKHHA